MISHINSICKIERKRIVGKNGAQLKTHFHPRVSSLQILQRSIVLIELLIGLNQRRTKKITLQSGIPLYR